MMGRPTSLLINSLTMRTVMTARIANPAIICPAASMDCKRTFAIFIGAPELGKMLLEARIKAIM